jgi:hypothetical protein
MPDEPRAPITEESLRQSMVNMAVESWRLSRMLERLLSKLDISEQNRYRGQFSWFIKKMEEELRQANLRIVNVEGQLFDPGMAATALNIEEFDSEGRLMVDQMLEPIIMSDDGLVRTGTVTLKREGE